MGRSGTNTKEKLVQTAIELVWKNSYGSVSVEDICKVSDVKKGSFYHFFSSKADLTAAAMEYHYQMSKPIFDEIFLTSRPPLERFEKLADIACEKQKETLKKYGHVCGCPFISLGSEMAGHEEIIRKKADEIFCRYELYYEDAIRDMVTAGQLPETTNIKSMASKVYTYVMGQIMMARIQNSIEPLERDLKSGIMRIVGNKTEEIQKA